MGSPAKSPCTATVFLSQRKLPFSCLCEVQAVKAVAEHVQSHRVSALVVDPVLVATSGDSLADSEVAEALKTHLFPLATVITPNLPEASALLGNRRVTDLESMKQVTCCRRSSLSDMGHFC